MDEVKAKRNSIIIKYILLSIGVILILAGSVYAFYIRNKTREIVTQKKEKIEIVDKKDDAQEENSVEKYYQKAGKGQSEALLEKCLQEPLVDYGQDAGAIDGSSYLYTSMLATAKKDVAVCDMLKKDDDIKKCQDRFYTFESAASKNDQCAKIGDMDLVGFCNARIKNDQSFCEGITSPYNMIFCEAAITGNVGKCNDLTDEYKGQCLDNVALVKAFESKKIEDCDSIRMDNRGGRFNRAQCRIVLSNDPQKEWMEVYKNNVCLEKYIFKMAMEKGDISICERIPQKASDNKQLYDECKKQF